MLVCEQRGCDLDDLTLTDFKAESDLFEDDITASLDVASIVAARTTEGGTGHAAVRVQLALAQEALAADVAALERRRVGAREEERTRAGACEGCAPCVSTEF